MGKQLLQDTMSIRLTMVESDGAGKTVARGEFARADVPTANKRIYGRKLWERELNKLRPLIEARKVYGELDHPADGKTKLSRAAILITSLELNKNGIVEGSFEVLSTTAGKDLQAIFDANGAVGVSSRGYGSVKMNEDGNDVVQDDYNLMTFDAVADPAQHTAYPEVSVEGKDVVNSVAETKGVSTKQLLTSDGSAPVQVRSEAEEPTDEKPEDKPEEDGKDATTEPQAEQAPADPEVKAKDNPLAAAAPQDGPNAAEAPGDHQKAFTTDNEVVVDEKADDGATGGSQPVDNVGTESGEPKVDADVVDGGTPGDGNEGDDGVEESTEVTEGGRLGIHLIKYPSGKYGFAGSIPVQLYWTNKDGSELSDEEAEEVAGASTPAMLAKSRSFKTVADALKLAAQYGVKKSDVSVSESNDCVDPTLELDEGSAEYEAHKKALGGFYGAQDALSIASNAWHQATDPAKKKAAGEKVASARMQLARAEQAKNAAWDRLKKVNKKKNEDVITKGQHDAVIAEMTSKFEGQLAIAMKQAHVQIEEKVLADLMSDPEVAGSKLALETVKRILRPYIMPSDVNESLELKEAELKGLRAKTESQQREIRNLTVAVKDLGFNLYLSKRLGNHPKFAKIVEGLGDLTKIESLEDLKTRVKLFEEELPEVLRMAQEARTKTVSKLKDRVTQLESQINETNAQMKKLSEERDHAIQTGLESASRAYLERRISRLDNPTQIRAAYENTQDRTKGGIDRLVESYQTRRNNDARDFTRIRERLGGRAKSATLVEDALKGTLVKDARDPNDDVRVTDQFVLPMKEMAKLAGLPQE